MDRWTDGWRDGRSNRYADSSMSPEGFDFPLGIITNGFRGHIGLPLRPLEIRGIFVKLTVPVTISNNFKSHCRFLVNIYMKVDFAKPFIDSFILIFLSDLSVI